VLDDVHGADFFRIKTPQTIVPTFILTNVEDFKIGQVNSIPDTHLDKADNQSL
jgi:hypothetical protein